jgi:central glycolytic genes regulator
LIKNINILIFGIGRADAMAIRRKLPKERINSLMEAGSVAEAFGHYFDIDGNEIWEYKTIGMTLDMYKQIRNLIGVAGGAQKAEAIIAITSLRRDITIVTDESAARRMLEIV